MSAIPDWSCFECAKWGKSTQIGYLDTFGIWDSSLKSLPKIRHLHVAAFGRGASRLALTTKSSKMSSLLPSFQKCTGRVRTVVFDNPLLPTGIVNGNETQLIRTKPGLFWNKNCQTCDYASTNQWLMMNGCDHQPVPAKFRVKLFRLI